MKARGAYLGSPNLVCELQRSLSLLKTSLFLFSFIIVICSAEDPYGVLMELFTATNGPQWTNNTGWGMPIPCIEVWYGVTCTQGYITKIDLYANNLRGTLPASLERLTSLQKLYLHSNSLSGTLPASWLAMSNLEELYVDSNYLNGTLPALSSVIVTLRYLYLHTNSFSGELPASWLSMSKLEHLMLHANSLNGTLPASWSNMSNLLIMHLQINQLSGTLPDSWGSLTNLQHAVLYGNRFTGTLPSPWSRMASLRQLYLHSNSLSGTLPEAWWRLSNIRYMYLISNSLIGTLPASWSNMSNLLHMHLYSNYLSGTLPSSWAMLSKLNYLMLSDNCLYGEVPEAYTDLKDLLLMSFCKTKVTGGFLLEQCTGSNAWPSRCDDMLTTPSKSLTSASWQITTSNVTSYTPSTWTCAVDPMEVIGSFPTLHMVPSNTTRLTAIITTAGSFGSSSAHTALMTVTTRPIARDVLTSVPDFAFNLSIAAPASAARWTVADVLMGSHRLNFTAVSQNTMMWHSVLVEPPVAQNGWLAPQTPLLVDRTLELRIVLSCDGEPVMTVDLRVPAPGAPRDFAERVVVVTKYSQLASVLAGGATSGSALGRTLATRSMVMCDAEASVTGGVLDLDLKICAETGAVVDTALASARSAVLSNCVLVGGVAVFLLLTTFLWASHCHCTLTDSMRALSVPSTLLPVSTVVLPSTSAAVTLLVAHIRHSPCMAADVVIVLLGIVLVLLPIVALTVVWRVGTCGAHPAWTCVPCEACSPQPRRGDGLETLHARTRGCAISKQLFELRLVFRRRWKWHVHREARNEESMDGVATQRGDGSIRLAWLVLLEYRLVWYGALDCIILAAVASLVVLGGLDAPNPSLCYACSTTVVVLIAGQLVLLAITRPFTTHFSFTHALMGLSLTWLSVTAQLAFVIAYLTDASGLWLAEFSAACDLAFVGITAVRILFDAKEAITAVRRRIAVLRVLTHRRADVDGQQSHLDIPLTEVHAATTDPIVSARDGGDETPLVFSVPAADATPAANSPHKDPQEAESANPIFLNDDAIAAEVELRFWDASGAALLVAADREDSTSLLAGL